MIWTGAGGNVVWLGRGGSVVCVDKYLLDGGEVVIDATAVGMTADNILLYNNYALSLTDLYLGDAVIFSNSSSFNVASEVQVMPTVVADTVTDAEVWLEANRQPYGAVHDRTLILLEGLEGTTVPDVANTVLAIVQLTSHIIYAYPGGVVAVNKGTRQVTSFVTLANTTDITYLTGYIYIGTSNAGVYRILESEMLNAGDRTAFISVKYSTSTTPSIGSNNIVALGGDALQLAIATVSELEYTPDHNTLTMYTMSQAGITDCSVGGSVLAYVVSGMAYSIAVPTANWSLNSADLAGLKKVGASTIKTYTTEITGSPTWVSVAGPAGEFLVSGDSGNVKYLWEIDPTTKDLTLIDTFTSTWNEGSSPHPQVRGEYIFSYGKTGERKLIVMKIQGNPDTIQEIYVQATSSWPSDTSVEELWVNEAGTFAMYPRGDAGTYQTVEPPPRYSVEYWYVHTRSGDTVSGPFTREFPNDMVALGFTPNGTYMVGLTAGGTPAGGKGSYYGMGFIATANGLTATVNVAHRANPVSIAFVDDSYMVTLERILGTGGYDYYLCLYSVSGSVTTYRDEIYLGFSKDEATGISFTFALYGYDHQIFLSITKTNTVGGGYAAEAEVRQYGVLSNQLVEMVNALEITTNYDTAAWYGPLGTISGGLSLSKALDYDIANGVSYGNIYNLQTVDFTSTEVAYTTANTVEVKAEVFIGTSEGIFIEGISGKLYSRHIADALQPILNAIALEASASADRDTGTLAYATSDGTDGFAGVIDLGA